MKKYYILALTFLCLLMGQSSFGQFISGDQDFAENYSISDEELTNLFADVEKQLDEIVITKYKSESGGSSDDDGPDIYGFTYNGGSSQGGTNSGDDCWFCSSDDTDGSSYLDNYFEGYFNGPNSGQYGYEGDQTVQHFIPFADGTNDIVNGINNGDYGLITQGVFWILADAYSIGGDRAIVGFLKIGDEVAVPIVKSAESFFKVGDDIAGFIVQSLKNGTNGKFAIIGRKMASVETVGNSLINEGKQIELFNTFYQEKNIFKIDGIDRGWLEITDEFNALKSQYGIIPDNVLENSLMFKANKIWAEKIKSLGYTIIDIGNQTNEATESIFYNMEITTIF